LHLLRQGMHVMMVVILAQALSHLPLQYLHEVRGVKAHHYL
jgi:hypothetical protein